MTHMPTKARAMRAISLSQGTDSVIGVCTHEQYLRRERKHLSRETYFGYGKSTPLCNFAPRIMPDNFTLNMAQQ